MAVDLSSSAGVVTLDLNAQPSDFYRLATTETVTSWTVSGMVDGDGFLLGISRNVGHTVSFTGLVDVWTNGVPTIPEGDTIYFPMIYDGGNWIGESSNVAASDPALISQVINHSVAGALTIDASSGHQVQVNLTANVTSHTLNNLSDGDQLAVTYLASGANRDVDFTGSTEFPTYDNPGNITITSGSLIQAIYYRTNSTTYLMSVTGSDVVTVNPALISQAIAHSSPGGRAFDCDLGHTAEVTLTADLTGHTINNLPASGVLSIHYLASGGARTVDFTGHLTADEIVNPGSVALSQNEVYRSVFVQMFGSAYLIAVEKVA